MAEIGEISQWSYRKGNSFSKRERRKTIMRNARSEEKLGSAISLQTTESCLLRRRISSPDFESFTDNEDFGMKKPANFHGYKEYNYSEASSSFQMEAPKVKIRVANIIRNPRFLLNSNYGSRNENDFENEYYTKTHTSNNYEKDKYGTDNSYKNQFLYSHQAMIANKFNDSPPRVISKEGKLLNRLYSSPTLGCVNEKQHIQRRIESYDSSKGRNNTICKTKYRIISGASSFCSDSDSTIKNQGLLLGNSPASANSTTINLCRSVPWKFLYKSDCKSNHSDYDIDKILYSESLPATNRSEIEDSEIKRARDINSEFSSKYFATDSSDDVRNLKGNFDMNLGLEDLANTSRITSVVDTRLFSDSWALVYKNLEKSLSATKSCFSSISRDKSPSVDGHILIENSLDHEYVDDQLTENVELKNLELSESNEIFSLNSSTMPKNESDMKSYDSSYDRPRMSITDLYLDFSVISTGRFSHICSCREKYTIENVAIKIIPKLFSRYLNQSHKNSDQLFSFLKSICHPNIVKVLRVLQDENRYYMIMEMCRGPTLLEHFMGYLPGTMDEVQVKSIVLQIFLALDVLHSNNFAHGDIKLENVMFKNKVESDSFGRKESLKIPLPLLNLIDLDSIKDLSVSRRINCNNSERDFFVEPHEAFQSSSFECDIMGTAPYMSPESHDGILCTASDMWSCGVLLYALFDGNFPFQLSEHLPLELRKDILLNQTPSFVPSIWLHHQSALDLCTRLLDPNPRTRIQSAREALIHEWFSSETFEIFSHNHCN